MAALPPPSACLIKGLRLIRQSFETDLSAGGAALRDAPALAPGAQVVLDLPQGDSLPARVVGEDGGLLRLAFERPGLSAPRLAELARAA
jgi:hypothetical protein